MSLDFPNDFAFRPEVARWSYAFLVIVPLSIFEHIASNLLAKVHCFVIVLDEKQRQLLVMDIILNNFFKFCYVYLISMTA